ncbi:MAG: asparagine--tRNA ligase [Flavobacteriales bacterium]
MLEKSIKALLREGRQNTNSSVRVKGWVRSFRSNRFIALNDGSTLDNIQAVIEREHTDPQITRAITTAAALVVSGTIVKSRGCEQDIEIQVSEIAILGRADPRAVAQTILQPKSHSLEKLREQAHLRMRTHTFGAVFRIRHAASFAIHRFFHENGFFCLHTPIITGSDAEGAGALFNVSTLDKKNTPLTRAGEVDYSRDFFGKAVHLTVSGQLEAEAGALALGKVYTFGPSFRAENSNTSRHLAEFWMVEPEMAFCDLVGNMGWAERFIKYVIQYVKDHCQRELAFLDARHARAQSKEPAQKRSELRLLQRLDFVLENDFKRVSYTEAIEVLKRCQPNKQKKFQHPIGEWGADLQSEHERYLVEKHYRAPVILFDYPARIKAFYMRLNDDGKTVRAMDILFPEVGEIAGGSQREERFEPLLHRMRESGLDPREMRWYLDTRKFGSVVHSGFGLGLERLLMFVTGMGNIRDVIPFPRTPRNAEF